MLIKDFIKGLKIDISQKGQRIQPSYKLCFQSESHDLKVGDLLQFVSQNEKQCPECGQKTKKLYRGFCYLCLKNKAKADLCVLNPHRCHFKDGTCREPQWGESFCYQPHRLYLSYTGGFKVGLTRATRMFERWCEQGALIGVELGESNSRYQAGMIEHHLSSFVSLSTHWKKMLEATEIDEAVFSLEQERILKLLEADSSIFQINDGNRKGLFFLDTKKVPIFIDYPGETKLVSQLIKFRETDQMNAAEKLLGIKGSYLILEKTLIPVHQLEGLKVEFKSNE
jgi:hypothetical protein